MADPKKPKLKPTVHEQMDRIKAGLNKFKETQKQLTVEDPEKDKPK